MSDFTRWLGQHLRPGYEIRSNPSGGLAVYEKATGEIVRTRSTNQPIRLADNNSTHYRNRILGTLRKEGVAYKGQISREKVRRRPPTKSETKSAVLLAQEILRARDSTPRERAMARHYLTMLGAQLDLMTLNRDLGEALARYQSD